MQLTGKQLIGDRLSGSGAYTFVATAPESQERLEPAYHEAQPNEIEEAATAAASAFSPYRSLAPERRAAFLRAIAGAIEELGRELIDRAHAETGLGTQRLEGERARTCAQLRMFADLIEEGSWVGARIDTAVEGTRPDLRRMLIPMGPVAVFGASNFPLAFSVAGGDTASALAAGCPVVVKAHPAHPGTSELVGQAVLEARRKEDVPSGVFSLLHGPSPETGRALVLHPAITAVGFTGSLRAGRAIFDSANSRPVPIPVYAEMGSTNPVFVLPGAAAERADELAAGMHASFTLGGGQFCTNPGLVLALGGDAKELAAGLERRIEDASPVPMLYQDLANAYRAGVEARASLPEVAAYGKIEAGVDCTALPVVFTTDAGTFRDSPELAQELFGPATLIVSCADRSELLELAAGLEGHLTATVHAAEGELREYADLVRVLQDKVGRLLYNGFPTGVSVSPAMQHGGPYPATTDSRSTSVGTAAIERFTRPICFQDFPDEALPPELQDGNPAGIWRLVDSEWIRS